MTIYESDAMFTCELSTPLIDALLEIAKNMASMPNIAYEIQDRLLEVIAQVLLVFNPEKDKS